MLANLSKATTLYFTPILMLTALLLILFAYLSPAIMLHSQVALLSITPSIALTQPGSSQSIDGPSMLLGPLGSCIRASSSDGFTCSTPSLSPTYNTSVFPSNAPSAVVSAPPATSAAFIAIALVLTVVFLITYTAISFRHFMGNAGAVWDKPLVQRASAWLGIVSFLLGLTSFLVVFMWFGKAAEDFNLSIQGQGTNGPQLLASTSNAFTMVWVGYAFFAIPVIVSLAKMHVLSTK
ncbi:hypothetical protein CONPUDRAFT_43699 [Coniophora puteana RWD-64-598 SS2]|uniref:Uncharacterized protein n=1 Tax=Coniophora puteana (strain RWD-64-598) TaxID=741705 RepID=A0A5M3N5U3_CONPW|nr:uncharacterized protein CONPUDRAFT_43699 [Coniophora puteana RWD-64-598 SS2]EIW86676.1 hypothetical protein CONPUDRAFT_43699 [Coniophora puteana RWD-64-598 SS2]